METLRYVPAVAAAAAVHVHTNGAAQERLRAVLDQHAVLRVWGDHQAAFVDLQSLTDAHPELGHELSAYWRSCLKGAAETRDLERTTVAAAQTDRGGVRTDLPEHLEALDAHPVLSGAVSDLLSSDADPASRTARAQKTWISGVLDAHSIREPAARWSVASDGQRLTVAIHGHALTRAALGGAAGPTEVSRDVTVHARHAGWRTRRLRRLAGVLVQTREAWPSVPGLALAAAAL